MVDNLKRLFKKFISLPYWWVIFSFFLFLWAIQINPPLNKEELSNGIWGVQILQSKDFSNNDFLNNIMYGYNRSLRLVYPVIIRVLHFSSPKQLYIFQLFLSFIFQLVLVRLTLRVSKNNIIGTILFCLTCTYYYFSNTASGDTFGHGDAGAFLFILLSLYFRNPFLILLSLFCAFFSNERSLMVALPTVWVWWFLNKEKHDKIRLWGAIPAAVVAYYVVRLFLLKQPHFKANLPNDVGFFYLIHNHTLFNVYLFGFGGLWLIVFYWIYKVNRIPIATLIILFFSMSAFIVADQTRGVSFMFPLFLIGFREIHRIETLNNINKLLVWGLILALFIPNFIYIGEYALRPSLIYHLLEKSIIVPIDQLLHKFL